MLSIPAMKPIQKAHAGFQAAYLTLIAHRYSHVRNYWEVNQAAVREMHRQVGD